jgi:heme exporter protein C
MKTMQNTAQPQRTQTTIGLVWLALTLVVLVIGFREALFISPPDANQGNVGRIIYWHVPSAMLGLVFPYVNFIASIAYIYLRRRNPLAALTADAWAIASAEVTVVFTSICLATGMLWGKAAWGIWWAWDWRLTSLLILWLLYVAYLMTRRLSAPGETATLGAIIAVFAAIDVPICYFSIRWFRTQHPSPVFGGGPDSGLDPSMMPAFLWNTLAWLMWGVFITGFRIALERRRQHLAQMETLRALEGDLKNFNYRDNSQPEHGNAF